MGMKFTTVPVTHRKWQAGDEFFIKDWPEDIRYRIDSREVEPTDGETKEYEYCVREIKADSNIEITDYFTDWCVSPKLAVYGLTQDPEVKLDLVRKIEWSD